MGNIVYTPVTGLGSGLFRIIAREFDDEMLQLKSRCDGAYGIGLRQDYRRYGGAALPGVRRVCIICLRVGSGFVVVNAVKAARRFVYQDFNLAIIARLS